MSWIDLLVSVVSELSYECHHQGDIANGHPESAGYEREGEKL